MSNSIITLYRNFVLEHVREIGSIESLVRTLLFFLPGSTRDSELKVEAGLRFFWKKKKKELLFYVCFCYFNLLSFFYKQKI